jgi:hypothetical protein
MVGLKHDVLSEAVIGCPICPKKYKVRTTKDHIKKIHGKTTTYECVLLLPDGSSCGFSCGERISCFNMHQTRKHNMDFSGKSKHRYDESTGFLLRTGGESMNGHSVACHQEADFYHSAQMKVARKNYRDKQEAIKKLAGEGGVAPCVEKEPEVKLKKNLKRKADGEKEGGN